MRPASPAAALLLLLLAGCASPVVPQEALVAAQPDPRVALVWDLQDCQAMTWEVPVPASRLAPRLPQGFSPSPAAGTSVPAGVEQVSLLGFETVECSAGYGHAPEATRSVPYARIYTPVIPPQGHADARDGTRHAFTWAVVVADDAWRERLGAAGLPVHDGGTLVGPSAQGYTGRVAFDGLGGFALSGRTTADEQPVGDAPTRDFTPALDQLAAWVGTREQQRSANGLGVWDAEPGSWVADVLGGTSGGATFRLEHYTLPHIAVIRPGAGGDQPFTGPRDDTPS